MANNSHDLSPQPTSRLKPEISLRDYVAEAWRVVEPGTPFTPNWHIDAICEHLEAVTNGEIRQLLVNVPPRHMKSLLVSVIWPTWVWTFRPESRWLSSSYAMSLARRDTVKARRIIQSPWYQQRWGHVFQLAGDQNEKSRYENDRTGHRIATSVDSAVTGEGGDFITVDDPHNVREMLSEAKREAVIDWWDQAMTTRLNDQATGVKVIVMQRLHADDLAGHVLAQGGWEHLMLPAEFEADRKCFTGIGWQDPRTEDGELLWPAKVPGDELVKMKRALGSYGTAGQLQQRPAPAEGGILKRHWWRFYEEHPTAVDEVIQSWDLAFKDTKSSAYVVGQVWARDGANFYLVDQVREKLGFVETITAIQTLTAKWPMAAAKLVEDKANGPAVLDSLSARVTGLIPIQPHGSKEARTHAVSPYIEAGNVFLPTPQQAPWVSDFIEECAAFPNGQYADQVDAMTQAIDRLALTATEVLVEYDAPVAISRY